MLTQFAAATAASGTNFGKTPVRFYSVRGWSEAVSQVFVQGVIFKTKTNIFLRDVHAKKKRTKF